MKVYCKRTVFNTDENIVIFSKGKYYNTRQPLEEFELSAGVYLWIESEVFSSSDTGEMVPVNLNYFNKYFLLVEELRNNKINEILK